MTWITPKTDWANDDACGYADFNRIENGVKHLSSITGATVSGGVKTTWSRAAGNYPFAAELNRIEKNIEDIRIFASLPINFGYQRPRAWSAGEKIDYTDLRRIEGNLAAVKQMYELIPPNFKTCGTFVCGEEIII